MSDGALARGMAVPIFGPRDARPEILITTDEYKVVDQAIAALGSSSEVFQRACSLVHIVRDESKLGDIVRTSAAPRIWPLSLPRLRELLTETAIWRRIVKGIARRDHPPFWAIQEVSARRTWKGIRRLKAIVEWPVLRPDGTVLDKPGYDDSTALVFLPSIEFGHVPEQPTLADARRAVDELLEIVVDFPFASREHRSVYLAGLLTPFARYAFKGPVPLVLVDANVRGSGKSLLCDTVGEVVASRPMARMAYPRDDIEIDKRVTAIAVAGEQIVLIDNVVGELGSASLDAALTAETWKGRILGKSEMTNADVPLRTMWWATGNNILLAADTARRVMHVRLDSSEERPEERSGFRHANLLEWVRHERARLVRAALTILRAYTVAGSPDLGLRPWGSFEAWSRLIRNAIVWAGEPDPGTTRTELVAQSDVEAGALKTLIAWLSSIRAGTA